MATALKFTQGATTDVAGNAVVGVAGAEVVVSNGDNTGVVFWRYVLLDAPTGSAFTPVPDAPHSLSAGAFPDATFEPDEPGTYQCRVRTYSDVGGTVLVGEDVRDFIVENARGWKKPATASTNKTMNYGGQKKGWKAAVDFIFDDIDSELGTINELTPPVSAPSGAGQFLKSISTVALTWAALTAADIPAHAGDVTGAYTASTVVAITGSGGVASVKCDLTWPSTLSAVNLIQATHATVAHPFTIQAGNVATGTGSPLILQSGAGSVARGPITFKGGATTLGSMTYDTGYWQFAGASTGFWFVSSSNNLFTALAGANFFDGAATNFRDAAQVATLDFALSSAGATSVTFGVGTTPTITQTTRANNNPCADLVLAPQSPYVLATGTNRAPGSLVVSLGAPTSGGTAEGHLILKRGGTLSAQFGPYDGATVYGAAWFGNGPYTASNFCFLANGVDTTYLSTPVSGGIHLAFGGNAAAAGSVSLTATVGFAWTPISVAAGLTQSARTTDAATGNFTITPQAPWGSATGTNRKGGNLNIVLAAPVGGSTAEARMVVMRDAVFAAALGPFESAGASYSTLWLGPGITPGSANYVLASNGTTDNYLNSPSAVGGFNISFAGANAHLLTAKGFQISAVGSVGNFGGGTGVLGLNVASVEPTTNPTSNGAVIYVDAAGDVFVKKSSGSLVQIA